MSYLSDIVLGENPYFMQRKQVSVEHKIYISYSGVAKLLEIYSLSSRNLQYNNRDLALAQRANIGKGTEVKLLH